MELISKELARCLVGTHIAFRSKGSDDNYSGVNLDTEIKFLEKESRTALSVGGTGCIMFLAELTNYYRQKSYYMAVRSGLIMHRYRPAVLDYMKLTPAEREERLMNALQEDTFERDFTLQILRYFIRSYPSRRKNFLEHLTRSEYLQLSV